MSLLYEVMANIRRYSGDEAVLRRSTVEFKRPVPVGEPLLVTARVGRRVVKRLAAGCGDNR